MNRTTRKTILEKYEVAELEDEVSDESKSNKKPKKKVAPKQTNRSHPLTTSRCCD